MTEWQVVGVIVTLVGLFMTVGKPLINLNKTITILNLNVEHISERLDEQEKNLVKQQERAHESHQKIWDVSKAHDEKLADHETRIRVLEKIE